MTIKPVETKKDWRLFVKFPYQLHQTTPNWIPPLMMEQKKMFNKKKNSLLQHCDYQFFLLYQDGQVIGRIAAFVDHVANEYWHDSVGFFGSYECIEDDQAAGMLLKTAEIWLKQKGMTKMRGPWNFVSQDIGFIKEGFDVPPVILSSYNPPYYPRQIENYGLSKVKDLLVYACDVAKGYQMPQRFFDYTDRVAQRYQVTVRSIDMKRLVDEVKSIVEMTNSATGNNWGYYPISVAEADEIAANLKMIIQPEAVLLAEVKGKPIGYLITLPDINTILKTMNGRLLPFGIFKLLRGIKKINQDRIWARGIIPEYQKKGIPGWMFRKLHEVLYSRRPRVEANWVLEDNHLMNNTLRQLKFDLVKRYRIYEKKI
ncbi:MAG: hypothetical protein ONB05_08740 [candidate division KSB1 bacterium]|nr:hypothetical protein [candidate division KSB1 bacterium]